MKTTYYTHNKKGNLYCILHLCQYQHEDIWYDAISYVDVETKKIYVEEEKLFDVSFTILK